MVAGVLVSFVLAAFAIKYLVDQVIVGVVLNVLVIGLTSFLFSPGAGAERRDAQLAAAVRAHRRSRCSATSRSSARCCFRQTIIVYLMYIAVAARVLRRSSAPAGACALRAVGEHPQAADTVGIKVNAHPVPERLCSPARSPASVARTSRSARSARSTRR